MGAFLRLFDIALMSLVGQSRILLRWSRDVANLRWQRAQSSGTRARANVAREATDEPECVAGGERAMAHTSNVERVM